MRTGMLKKAAYLSFILFLNSSAFALLQDETGALKRILPETGRALSYGLNKPDGRERSALSPGLDLKSEGDFESARPEIAAEFRSLDVPVFIGKKKRTSPRKSVKYSSGAARPSGGSTYRIRRGDTLYSVSRKFKVPVDSLVKTNSLNKNSGLIAGRVLRIPSSSTAKSSNNRIAFCEPSTPVPRNSPKFIWPVRTVHEIKRGESGVARPIGITIESRPGTAVHSSAGGIVEKIGSMRGYGRYVIIKHGGHYLTVYSGLNKIDVSEGDRVPRGRIIGRQDGELHFQINHSGKALNPLQLLPERG